jgi:thioredoxin reductase (NADPH)
MYAWSGGGNTAVEGSCIYQTSCKHVTVIHRSDKFRSEKILQDGCLPRRKPKVDFLWNHTLDEVLGDKEPA